MPFDISTRRPKDTVVVIVKDPKTNEDTDISITLHALYSPQARAAKFVLADRAEADKVGNTQGAAELDARLLDLLAACTVGWENIEEGKGNTLEFSPDAARTVYNTYPWLREQVQTSYFAADAFFADAGTRS